MKTKKLSFMDIKGLLNRDEMKKVMGGSADVCSLKACSSDSDCGSVQGRDCKCKWQGTYSACV